MVRSMVAVMAVLALAVGCIGPANEGERSVRLELDQEDPDSSPLAGDGENCLVLVPEDEGALDRVEAEASWEAGGSNPQRLSLELYEVQGDATVDEATGPPSIEVRGDAIDGKANLAVSLPDDASVSAENLTVELTYRVEGPLDSTATATCEP